jgi:asparagine synthase (glutamine-hydrolysing)
MFYWGSKKDNPLVNICNMMTLRYDPGQHDLSLLKRVKYDEIKRRKQPYPSPADLEEKIRKVVKTSIEYQKPRSISVALSSGVDSNLILSLIRNEFPNLRINCVTISFDESTEAHTAKTIAENNSCAFHNLVIENPLRELPHLISIAKEPRWNLYQYYFIQKSSDFSKLLFTGDGGDELFGGYTFRYKRYLGLHRKNLNWQDKVRHYLNCHNRDWVPDQAEMFGPSLHFKWESIYFLFKTYFNNDLDPLDQVFLADYHGKLLYDFVPANNKFFNYFSLIGIAPLLDESIINLSINMPPSLKYDPLSNIGKIPLRKIIARYEGHNVSKTKIGFGLDLKLFWLRLAKGIVTSNLDKARIFEDKIINREFYNRSLKRIDETQDVRYISKMLQLLSLEIWYRMFKTFEMSSKSIL